MLRLNRDTILMLLLFILAGILIFLNIEKRERLEIEEPKNILFDESTKILNISSLTLKQKIAQMIITHEKENEKELLRKMFIGGIHFSARPNKKAFIDVINYFQNNTKIPFFIAVDMEGCWNPFENFQEFPTLREIKNEKEAYKLGFEKGKLLSELGFNMNFAPVVDLEDNIWKCRNFVGTPREISNKAKAYIEGLRENKIIATSKHYPGKTLQKEDPHEIVIRVKVGKDDLLPFEETIKNNVTAVLVSHAIVEGIMHSESKPAVVSEVLINNLKDKFTGLVISDEIKMLGLRNFYKDENKMYVDLFKAKNDIILNFDNSKNLYKMIGAVEKAIIKGEISEERIDESVKKILMLKGIKIVE